MSDTLTRISMIDRKDGCKHLRYFEFPIDPNGIFNYNARRSLNAFFSWKFTRNEHDGILFVQDSTMDIRVIIKERYPDVMVTKLNSIYEFYRIIGYDYKTHTYINLKRR